MKAEIANKPQPADWHEHRQARLIAVVPNPSQNFKAFDTRAPGYRLFQIIRQLLDGAAPGFPHHRHRRIVDGYTEHFHLPAGNSAASEFIGQQWLRRSIWLGKHTTHRFALSDVASNLDRFLGVI